jgi:hypothetical protein
MIFHCWTDAAGRPTAREPAGAPALWPHGRSTSGGSLAVARILPTWAKLVGPARVAQTRGVDFARVGKIADPCTEVAMRGLTTVMRYTPRALQTSRPRDQE